MNVPANAKTYEFRTVIPATLEQVMAFHADPKALPMLTPPPIFVQLHRRNLKSLTDGDMEFTLWFGPLPVRWLAHHEPGPTPASFADRVVCGPVAYWRHEHIFRPVPGGVELTDSITVAHKSGGFWGIFTRLFFSGLPLRLLFFYRHLRTRLGARRITS